MAVTSPGEESVRPKAVRSLLLLASSRLFNPLPVEPRDELFQGSGVVPLDLAVLPVRLPDQTREVGEVPERLANAIPVRPDPGAEMEQRVSFAT